MVETTEFDLQRLWPASISAQHNSTNLLTLGFLYDPNSNVQRQVIQAPGLPDRYQFYGYDALNRLQWAFERQDHMASPSACGSALRAGESWCRAFGYDRYGNRMLPTALGVGVAPGTPTQASDYSSLENNRLSAGSYDNRGNLLAYTAMGAMTYTAQNKMATMTRTVAGGTTTGEYVYDGLGQRIQRVTKAGSNPAVTTYYIYDAMGRLAQERSTATPAVQDQGLFFRTTDHLGSTRLITTAGGAVYRRHDFLPFGEDIPTSVGGRAGATGYNPLPDAFAQRFTAKERDDESNLDYFLARYYASSLGRFTSADPVQITIDRLIFPQQLNRYAYTQNNPLVFVDPTGLDLELAGNVQGGTGILCDIVGQSECGRISVDAANQVTFNTKGLDLSKNEGAALVADLVGSSAKFQFSVGNSVNTAGGLVTITDANGSGGIINLDNNPDIRLPGGKVSTALPPTGVDGLVGIDPNARPRFDNGGQGSQVPTSALAFHELSESFAKVGQGLQYLDTTQTAIQNRNGFITIVPHAVNTSGAHSQAIQRELILRSQRPSLQRQGRAGGNLRQP